MAGDLRVLSAELHCCPSRKEAQNCTTCGCGSRSRKLLVHISAAREAEKDKFQRLAGSPWDPSSWVGLPPHLILSESFNLLGDSQM